MDIFHKWKEILSDQDKRQEWINFYQKNDPIFKAVIDFCKNQNSDNQSVLELTIIAILDEKIKTLSDRHKMAHYMTRPLPGKLVTGQASYPEDHVDFGNALIDLVDYDYDQPSNS